MNWLADLRLATTISKIKFFNPVDVQIGIKLEDWSLVCVSACNFIRCVVD